MFAAFVAGCGGGQSTTVTPSSVPAGDGSDGGAGGGGGGDGGAVALAPCATTPQLIASRPFQTQGLAVDDGSIYVAAHDRDLAAGASTERVWALPLAGGTARALGAADGAGGAARVVVTATDVVFAEAGALVRFARDGSRRDVLARADAQCLAAAGDQIYYCDVGGIRRVPVDGSAAPVTVVATRELPAALAVDGSALWLASSMTVQRADAGGSGAVDMIREPEPWIIRQLAVDDRRIYSITGQSGVVWVADKVAGTTATPLVRRDGTVDAIALAGDHVYWLGHDASGAHIGRVAGDGSGAVTLVDAQAIDELVVRGDSVYYLRYADGAVYRVCR